MNVGLLKTSLVNFPGRVATAVFLPGCNLRCPFCHNGELASASIVSGPHPADPEDSSYVTIDEVLAHLEKRKTVLGGLAISGGEPLLSPALSQLIAKARNLSLLVKIDTNGTLPDRLLAILDDPNLRPDMLAVDVKTTPDRYAELAMESEAGLRAGIELRRTIDILSRENPSTLRVEYRTVLVPGLVGESELREIASMLPHNADWQLATFVPGTCLDPSYNSIEPYGPVETKRLVAVAASLIPKAKLR